MFYMKSILPTPAIPIPIPKKKRRRDNRIHNRPLEPIELELTSFASGGRAVGHLMMVELYLLSMAFQVSM